MREAVDAANRPFTRAASSETRSLVGQQGSGIGQTAEVLVLTTRSVTNGLIGFHPWFFAGFDWNWKH